MTIKVHRWGGEWGREWANRDKDTEIERRGETERLRHRQRVL